MGVPHRQTPREKKDRDLERRVDLWNENQKSARKHLRIRRARLERAYRHRVRQELTRGEDADTTTIRRGDYLKWPGPTLAQALEHKQARSASRCEFAELDESHRPRRFRTGIRELLDNEQYRLAFSEAWHHHSSKNNQLAALACLFLAEMNLSVDAPDTPLWRLMKADAHLEELDPDHLGTQDQQWYQRTLSVFQAEILQVKAAVVMARVDVRCPGCDTRGVLDITQKKMIFRCMSCDLTKHSLGVRDPRTVLEIKNETPTLGGLALVRTVRTKHGVLWAYNKIHLAQLQALIAPQTQRSLAERVAETTGMPPWIAQPKNRDDVAKALAKMKPLK